MRLEIRLADDDVSSSSRDEMSKKAMPKLNCQMKRLAEARKDGPSHCLLTLCCCLWKRRISTLTSPPCWAGTLCWPKRGNFPDLPVIRMPGKHANRTGRSARFESYPGCFGKLVISHLKTIFTLSFICVMQNSCKL